MRYKHFKIDDRKFIDDNDNEITTKELVSKPHYVFENDGFIAVDTPKSGAKVVSPAERPKTMKLVDILKQGEIYNMIDKVRKIHPYKQIGNADSYSQYNQGWEDACDRMEDEFENTVEIDDSEAVQNGDVNGLQSRLEAGRHYLMGVEPRNLTVEDALEAFGYLRNGLEPF